MEAFFTRAKPEDKGLLTAPLERLWEDISGHTGSLVVIAAESVVFERYGQGMDSRRRHYTASMAKAVVGGLSLMLAMDDGLIGLDDLACRYIPAWKGDPTKSRITIRQLAAHTSGLADARSGDIPHDKLPGWMGAFWRRENPFVLARDEAPVLTTPGTKYEYSNIGIAMLTYAVTSALKDAPLRDVRTLLWERVIRLMGIPADEWSIGYDETFTVDGLPLVGSWGGGAVSTRCLAAIGQLMLRRGQWKGQRLISESTVEQCALTHSGMDYAYGATWRINSDHTGQNIWPELPPDAYAALGAGHQALFVVPSRDLVVVRYGDRLPCDSDRLSYDAALIDKLANPLGRCLRPWVTAPKSDFIKAVKWAPASSIPRLATGGKTRDGSDNWPMTWADDDALYTAYGDGYGFAPHMPSKLGMGFAKIVGNPNDFTALNLRSDAENRLWGANGKKSSGLLMVNGLLYMWARNSDGKGNGSRLAVSRDRGAHFDWCPWAFRQFGHMAFVNYGRNYAGARDNYVYMLSHDRPSAYENGDGFVLLRAPKNALISSNSYEIYCGLDSTGAPIFARNLDDHSYVLSCPGKARRASVSYNAGLGRYLLWQQHQFNPAHSDTRYEGGLGIYEAPEPWGPWKCVYFSERWDIGPGDLGCFPTKWMSADGKTLFLVFSGDDNFCVRGLEFALFE